MLNLIKERRKLITYHYLGHTLYFLEFEQDNVPSAPRNS